MLTHTTMTTITNPTILRKRDSRCSLCRQTGHKIVHCTERNPQTPFVSQCYQLCLQAYADKNPALLIEWLNNQAKPTLFLLAGEGSSRKSREQLIGYIVYSRLYMGVYMAPHNLVTYTNEMRKKYTDEMLSYLSL